MRLCNQCMEKLNEGNICPHCGYDESKSQDIPYALQPGTILNGKYLIGNVLGQGGFGITYIGLDLALDIKVAIKEYYVTSSASRVDGKTQQVYWMHKPDNMDHFIKEARRMAKLEKMPEIAHVRDVFYANNTAYIIMEYVNGQTLKQYLQKNGTMSWEHTIRLMLPVISALGRVHSEYIIHRDVTPDNLMMEPQGTLRVLDLGAAGDLSQNNGQASQMVAREGFSPYEQYLKNGKIGPWTDVYSVCATIYYCCTGKVIPDAYARVNQMLNAQDARLPMDPVIPPAGAAVLQNGLALDVSERIPNMQILEQQLKASLEERKKEVKQTDPPDIKFHQDKEHITDTPGKPKPDIKKWILPGVAAILVVVISIVLLSGGGKDVINRRRDATLAAGPRHTVMIMPNGTVRAAGWNGYQQCELSNWYEIVEIAVDRNCTVGVCSDGTVIAAGTCGGDVSGWTDIVAVAIGEGHTVGLKSDGTLVCVGKNDYGQCNVDSWRNIADVAAGARHTVGLRNDGTVVAAGWNEYGQCEVADWTDIVAVAAGDGHTVGLKSDGTIVSAGANHYSQTEVSAWRNITAISAGANHTVGLKADGTVVAAGWNDYEQCNTASWTDIVAVSAGTQHTVGKRADGTIISVGSNEFGQCDIS